MFGQENVAVASPPLSPSLHTAKALEIETTHGHACEEMIQGDQVVVFLHRSVYRL